MEQRNLALWLAEQFSAEHWERAVSKDDLIAAAGDDEDLACRLALYPEGGLYRSPEDVLKGEAHRGWEDQRLPGPLGGDEDTAAADRT